MKGTTFLDHEPPVCCCIGSGNTLLSSGFFQGFCYDLSYLALGPYLCDCNKSYSSVMYLLCTACHQLVPDVCACGLQTSQQSLTWGTPLVSQSLYNFFAPDTKFLVSCHLLEFFLSLFLLFFSWWRQQIGNTGGDKYLQVYLNFTASYCVAIVERHSALSSFVA